MNRKKNVLTVCLMFSIFFILFSPSKYSAEHDFKACVNEVTADEHECESRCDTNTYNRGFFSHWFGTDDKSRNSDIVVVDPYGGNACYMNCQNRKVAEISLRCQHLLAKPAPAAQPVEPQKPRAPIPNLDKLITWPDSVKDLKIEDDSDIPVRIIKKKSKSKPKTIQQRRISEED